MFPLKKKHKAEKPEMTFPSLSVEHLFILSLRLSSQYHLCFYTGLAIPSSVLPWPSLHISLRFELSVC